MGQPYTSSTMTTHHLDLAVQSLPHIQLSGVAHLFTIDMMNGSASSKFTDSRDELETPNKDNCISSTMKTNTTVPASRNTSCPKEKVSRTAQEPDSTDRNKCQDRQCSIEPDKASAENESQEEQNVKSLHGRGLLALGDRTLFERDFRLPVQKEGLMVGVAHWFNLRGIFDIRNRSKIDGNPPATELPEATIDSNLCSYYQQTVKLLHRSEVHAAENDSFSNRFKKPNDTLTHSVISEGGLELSTPTLLEQSVQTSPPNIASNVIDPKFQLDQTCIQTKDDVLLTETSTDSVNFFLQSNIAANPLQSHLDPTPLPLYTGSSHITATSSHSHDTSPEREACGMPSVITVGDESPCSQACFMLDEPLHVEPGQNLRLDCVYRKGCFWVDAYQ